MGDQNHISYKEIFSLIRKNKLWLGVDNGGNKWFEVREHYNIKTEARKKIVNGKKYFKMSWYKAHSSLSTDQCSIDLIDRCINCGSEKSVLTYCHLYIVL